MPTYTIAQHTTQSKAHRVKLANTNLASSNSSIRTLGKVRVNSRNPENWWFGGAMEMGNVKSALLYYVKQPGDYIIHKWEQLKNIRRGTGHVARITQSWKISITGDDLFRRNEVRSAKVSLDLYGERFKNFFEKSQKVDVLRDIKNVMPKV